MRCFMNFAENTSFPRVIQRFQQEIEKPFRGNKRLAGKAEIFGILFSKNYFVSLFCNDGK